MSNVSIPAQGPREAYEPECETTRLGYLVEECGEVLAAAGKSLRWGYESSNPELPVAERETNRAWLRREIGNLKAAIERIEPDLVSQSGGDA